MHQVSPRTQRRIGMLHSWFSSRTVLSSFSTQKHTQPCEVGENQLIEVTYAIQMNFCWLQSCVLRLKLVILNQPQHFSGATTARTSFNPRQQHRTAANGSRFETRRWKVKFRAKSRFGDDPGEVRDDLGCDVAQLIRITIVAALVLLLLVVKISLRSSF